MGTEEQRPGSLPDARGGGPNGLVFPLDAEMETRIVLVTDRGCGLKQAVELGRDGGKDQSQDRVALDCCLLHAF